MDETDSFQGVFGGVIVTQSMNDMAPRYEQHN